MENTSAAKQTRRLPSDTRGKLQKHDTSAGLVNSSAQQAMHLAKNSPVRDYVYQHHDNARR